MPRYEQTTEPIRVKASERQRIARRPKVAEEVTGPALLAFVMLLVGGIGYQFNAAALMIAGFGSLAVLALLTGAYFVNSNQAISETWQEREEPTVPGMVQEPGSIPVNRYGKPAGQVDRLGPIVVVDGDFRWQFTPDDRIKLTRWLDVENTVRRDANGDKPGMTMLEGVTTANYARLLLALKRAGLVSETPGGVSYWNADGEAWITGGIGPVVEVDNGI